MRILAAKISEATTQETSGPDQVRGAASTEGQKSAGALGVGMGPVRSIPSAQPPVVSRAIAMMEQTETRLGRHPLAFVLSPVLSAVSRALPEKAHHNALKGALYKLQATLIEQPMVPSDLRLRMRLQELNKLAAKLGVGDLELVPHVDESTEQLGYQFQDDIPDGQYCKLCRAPDEGFGTMEPSGLDAFEARQREVEKGPAEAQPKPALACAEEARAHLKPRHERNVKRSTELMESLHAQVQHLPPEERPQEILRLLKEGNLLTLSEVIDPDAYVVDQKGFHTQMLFNHIGDPPESSFHLRVFAWGPGQMTLPHGHGSHGAVFAAKGDVWQIMYQGQERWAELDEPKVWPREVLKQNQGAMAQVSGELDHPDHIHAMGQALDGEGTRVTVHYYYGARHDAEDDIRDICGVRHPDLHRQNFRLTKPE